MERGIDRQNAIQGGRDKGGGKREGAKAMVDGAGGVVSSTSLHVLWSVSLCGLWQW